MGNSRRAWLWACLAIVTIALAIDPWARWHPLSVDFRTYLAAARVGLQYGWPFIYDQALVKFQQDQIAISGIWTQPYLSPPTVAFLVAPLTLFPYWVAYGVWAVFTLTALAMALAWSGFSTGISRWIAVIAALSPWWVLHASIVGQVVPLVAAGVVVAWRLLREDRDVAAGLVLGLIFLKPNTAMLVPIALLAAGRYRAVAAWAAVGAALVVAVAVVLGGHGLSAYVNELRGPLPSGADAMTLKGAAGLTGVGAAVVRVLIVGVVVVTASKLRASPGLLMPIAIVGTLLVSPYLHGSDLCLLSVAAWILWEERNAQAWRVSLATGWILASPYLLLIGVSPQLNQWPWFELALLLALLVTAWWPLTAWADSRRRAPA